MPKCNRDGWRRVLGAARKRAALACLRCQPLYKLSRFVFDLALPIPIKNYRLKCIYNCTVIYRHRSINIFTRSYCELWLQDENIGQEVLIEDLTQSFEDSELKKVDTVEEEGKPDPLTQLVTTFCRGAMTERSGALQV